MEKNRDFDDFVWDFTIFYGFPYYSYFVEAATSADLCVCVSLMYWYCRYGTTYIIVAP